MNPVIQGAKEAFHAKAQRSAKAQRRVKFFRANEEFGPPFTLALLAPLRETYCLPTKR